MEGETLLCSRETRSKGDPFAVAMMKSGKIIGHVLRSLSCVCSLFLERGVDSASLEKGSTTLQDLPQGGRELPCIYVFPAASTKKEKCSSVDISLQSLRYLQNTVQGN